MKDKSSKSNSSINSSNKDEPDSKQHKNESKNKEASHTSNGKGDSNSDISLIENNSSRNRKNNSGNDILNSILNDTKRSSGSAGWESGIKILDAVKVIIPLKLLLVCNQIAERLNGEEFSILVNLTEKDKIIRLSKEFHIPQQVVSTTSIDYIPEDSGFNTVIHRHPDGLNSFSSTDKNFINQNFKLSILYTHKEGFVHGVYNLKHDNYLVQLPIEISVDMGMELIDIDNIKTVRASRNEIDKRLDAEEDRFLGSGRAYGSMFGDDDDLPFGRSLDRRHDYRGKRREVSDEKASTFDLDKDGTIEEKRELKKLEEENLDYGLIKRMILEDVNDNIETLDMRLSNMEDFIQYSGHFI